MGTKFKKILAVETSCDDTSAAVVDDRGWVHALCSADQNREHQAFGGIVPEIASRNHSHHLLPLIDRVLSDSGCELKDLDGFAVTARPGLIGSLMVGLVTVKTLAMAMGKPFIGVNHLEGHLLAPFLRDNEYSPPEDFQYPYLALAISGGHTSLYEIAGLGQYQVMGQTLDDAAGEAFDKFGTMVGLGFPGGVRVDKHAKAAENWRDRFSFVRSFMNEEHLNFSFSGMKASARRLVLELSEADKAELQSDLLAGEPKPGILADLCAGFQEAVVDVLLDRLRKASEKTGLTRVVLTGGVSANSRLRVRAQVEAATRGWRLVIPPLRYCTDNAAMIGFAGILRLNAGETSPFDLAPEARAPLGIAPLPANLPDWLVKAQKLGQQKDQKKDQKKGQP